MNIDDSDVLLYCDALDDIERTRIANENRLRSLEQVKEVSGGTPAYHGLAAMNQALAAIEKDVERQLQKIVRRHTLYGWISRNVGVGEKQGARLIGTLPDLSEFPNVAKLWAYCGYHVKDGAAPRRTKGEKANWSSTAKMRAYLIAESCLKQEHSPYRKVYDVGREKYEDAVHAAPCAQCAGKGKKPETVLGEPLRPGHQHMRAMRLVSKEILKDLWVEAHAQDDDQPPDDNLLEDDFEPEEDDFEEE